MGMNDSYPLPPGLADYLSDLPLHELDFTPVPVKARHDGWTPARQRGFILRLALIGCVASSATAVGMTRESAYQLRKHPGAAGFVAAWTKAIGWGRSHASDLRLTRALIGEVQRVYYRGRKIDEYVRFDNRLLMAGSGSSPCFRGRTRRPITRSCADSSKKSIPAAATDRGIRIFSLIQRDLREV